MKLENRGRYAIVVKTNESLHAKSFPVSHKIIEIAVSLEIISIWVALLFYAKEVCNTVLGNQKLKFDVWSSKQELMQSRVLMFVCLFVCYLKNTCHGLKNFLPGAIQIYYFIHMFLFIYFFRIAYLQPVAQKGT